MKAITAALRRYQQRGAGLAGVLAIMTIAALAAFTMAAVTMSHAGRARRAVNAQQALFLAEGAMAQAISRIKSDGT
ncbi:MAG: hypothetical protein EB084_26395, partial [Proteobacteria bacterium]|nr:hypothetical protein [Pseudomonadota bacterium]